MTRSAGIILYRFENDSLRVLIAHMGGPFWAKKDERGWSIPKGEYGDDEEPRAVAAREFQEELGSPVPPGDWLELGEVKQPSGKKIVAFALEADFDASNIVSNHFEMEWPKKSGNIQSFPEVDRAGWFDVSTASMKLVKGQVPILERLVEHLQSEGRLNETESDLVLF